MVIFRDIYPAGIEPGRRDSETAARVTVQNETPQNGTPQALASIRDAYAGKLFPCQQLAVFGETERVFPTRVIRRGRQSRPLPVGHSSLRDLVFESNGASCDIYDFVSRNRVVGLLVLAGGRIALEHYDFGCDSSTRWMSMSMAKSISTTLVGAALRDGCIGSLDDPLRDYVPELAGGAYAAVTIRQLLLMSSGVQWNEDHTDPASERRAVLELQIAQRPGSILKFMSELPRVARPGRRWNYSTGETYLLGPLLKAATGRWLADYLSEKIWSPLGMEADATWWLESPGGLETAGSGINATLRDYARFGQFILAGGEPVLPHGWLAAAGGPTDIGGEQIPYGYMWWTLPSPSGAYSGSAFSARGIFGQRIYIDPRSQLVVVICSARSKPTGDQAVSDDDFFNAVAKCIGVHS